VAEIKRFRLSGFVAWVTWLAVHLWYLVGFENRLLVVIRWAFSFLAHGRGARLITDRSDGSGRLDGAREDVRGATVGWHATTP
jgi:NADH:quinone reductase (non-electrogenic)